MKHQIQETIYLNLKIVNVIYFGVRNKSFKILISKLKLKFSETFVNEKEEATLWAEKHLTNLENYLTNIDSKLFKETKLESTEIASRSIKIIQKLRKNNIDLGGGGAVDLIYFCMRKLRPTHVLETGVAAGFSTFAILTAAQKNGFGKLDSSDLPYFRIKNPEKYIAIVVPEKLKNENFRLLIKGDNQNLNYFLVGTHKYGLVHYDSDKRKISRKKFFKRVKPWFSNSGVLIMDDIQDNLAFKEIVEENSLDFKVFTYDNKYVGMAFIGNSLLNL